MKTKLRRYPWFENPADSRGGPPAGGVTLGVASGLATAIGAPPSGAASPFCVVVTGGVFSPPPPPTSAAVTPPPAATRTMAAAAIHFQLFERGAFTDGDEASVGGTVVGGIVGA